MEDDPDDAEILRRQLKNLPVEIHHCQTLAGAHKVGECDVVLLDLNLQDSAGVETVKKFRAAFPWLPIVVLSHILGGKIQELCEFEGADAFLVKRKTGDLAILKTLQIAIQSWRDRYLKTDFQESHRRLEKVSREIRGLIEKLD